MEMGRLESLKPAPRMDGEAAMWGPNLGAMRATVDFTEKTGR